MPTKGQPKKQQKPTKKEQATIAKLNLRLYRVILLCIEILILGWIALVNNGIFGIYYELEAPFFIIMAVVFFVILLGVTFFAKERNMLIMCTIFLIAAFIGAAFVPSYIVYGETLDGGEVKYYTDFRTLYAPECEQAPDGGCADDPNEIVEHRNVYWLKVNK